MTSDGSTRPCPQCGRLNARSATVCNCGHDYAIAAMRELTSLRPIATMPVERIARIARSYRSLLLYFAGVWFLQGGVRNLAGAAALIGGLVLLALAIGMLITTYRLADDLDLIAPLWAVGMLVPLVNLVMLLMLSSKATKACREAGLSVGFLGPSAYAIEDFLRRKA